MYCAIAAAMKSCARGMAAMFIAAVLSCRQQTLIDRVGVQLRAHDARLEAGGSRPRRDLPHVEAERHLVGGHPFVGDPDLAGLPPAQQAATGRESPVRECLREVPAVLERLVEVVQAGHCEQPADAGASMSGLAALSGVSSYAIFCVRPGRLARSRLTPSRERCVPSGLNLSKHRADREEQHTQEHPGLVRDHVAEGRRPGRQQHTLDRLDQHGRQAAVCRPGASPPAGTPSSRAGSRRNPRLTRKISDADLGRDTLAPRERRQRRRDAGRGEHLHEPDHGRALPVSGRPEQHDGEQRDVLDDEEHAGQLCGTSRHPPASRRFGRTCSPTSGSTSTSLGGGDSVGHQLCVEGDVARNHAERDRGELVVPGARADEARRTVTGGQVGAAGAAGSASRRCSRVSRQGGLPRCARATVSWPR
jgi:hypothetical protein